MRIREAVLVCLLLPSLAGGDEHPNEAEEMATAVADSTRIFVPAKRIDTSPPSYPRHLLQLGHEAWIHITYCVDESGTPQNVSVADSVGDKDFVLEAISTINEWRFEPALIDGEPSWQSRNHQIVLFAISNRDKGADRGFIRQYKRIGKLIEDGELEAADSEFQELFDDETLSLYEIAKLWALRANYEFQRGDHHLADIALYRATVSKGQWIEEEHYLKLLAMRVYAELQLGQYGTAIQAYEVLETKADEESEFVLALGPVMSNLYDTISGESALKSPAEVRRKGECYKCDDSYVFDLVRRDITFSDVEGELSSIEMRCDHKHLKSEISELVEWHVPEAWGDCTVHVFGKPGTTFNLFHLPAA